MQCAFPDTTRRPEVYLSASRDHYPDGGLSSFPSELSYSHLPKRLCLLPAELLFLSTTRVSPRRHVLHQRPQVQRVGIVPYYRSTCLFASYLGDVLLMVAVKYDGRTTDDIFFDE